MLPAFQVKLLKVAINLRFKWWCTLEIQDYKTLYTLQTYFDFAFLNYIVYIQSKFFIISLQRILLCISFHKKPICCVQDILKQAGKLLWQLQIWCHLLPISEYSDALSELKSKKSYTVYIPEKHIPLLRFTEYIMLRSLLKYFWKGFEIVLKHYVIIKTLNFMHMNSTGSFHPTSDVMSDL